MQQTDTITLNMVSEIVPYLPQTSNLSADILGTFNDPVFGRTTASLYTQLKYISGVAPTWTFSSTMDSVVLVLKMSNTSQPIGSNNFAGQTWHIFQQANAMTSGIVYPSDTILTTSWEIGKAPVRFNAIDSTVRITIKSTAINKAFRNYMFDTTGNGSLFTDPTYFDAFIHGLYIMPDSTLALGRGELAAFNINDTNAKFTIYYDGGNAWAMNMASGVEHVNIYNHNYTGTQAWNNAGTKGKKSDRVYVQSLAGERCIVTIPYLANLVQNQMIAVNQAEFIFPKVDSTSDQYNNNNPSIMLFRPRMYSGSDSLFDFTDDNASLSYYGGAYQTTAKSYKFLMTRYIQRLLFVYRNKPTLHNYGINLYIPPDGPNSPSRTLLYTQFAGNKQNRPKLVITYTKISDKK